MRQRLCKRTVGYLPLAASTLRLCSLSIIDVLATTYLQLSESRSLCEFYFLKGIPNAASSA